MKAPSLYDLMVDPRYCGGEFSAPSWAAWRTIARAIEALEPTSEDLELWARLAAWPREWPSRPCREVWIVAGRRGGKSRFLALCALHAVLFADRSRLAPGEVARVQLVAQDRAGARLALDYVEGLLRSAPVPARIPWRRVQESIEFDGAAIEVAPCNFRGPRGRTLLAACCDEASFWYDESTSANPDTEIVGALRPGLASTGGRLIVASSPFRRAGLVWQVYDRATKGELPKDIVVIRAPTRLLNPALSEEEIARQRELDPVRARSEFEAEFRDLGGMELAPREIWQSAVVPGRARVGPEELDGVWGIIGVIDPSSGLRDASALAIAGALENGRARLLEVRWWVAPCDPRRFAAEAAAALEAYDLSWVYTDNYAAGLVRSLFDDVNIGIESLRFDKSAAALRLLFGVRTGKVELLDCPRLIDELTGWQRRPASGGHEIIDHLPGAHDDVATAVAAAIAIALDMRPLRFY